MKSGRPLGPARCRYIMVIVKEMCGGVVDAAEFFLIFVWVLTGRRALPGDRIAVDTAETGEQQPPRAGRISSKSGVSGSGGGWICDVEKLVGSIRGQINGNRGAAKANNRNGTYL